MDIGLASGNYRCTVSNLTPGTRSGVIYDDNFSEFTSAIKPLETRLNEIISEQRKAEDERASRKILRSVQNALKEAILSLPKDEYDWFDIHMDSRSGTGASARDSVPVSGEDTEKPMAASSAEETLEQKEFFEFAGPLFSVRISPASAVVSVGESKNFRAIPRDQRRRLVEEGLTL